jgi:type IV pilus assembly protein PilV
MLIEALVAIIIFSFGVLGLVGLQASMTKAQTASKYRADAAHLAHQLIGTIWADTPNLAQYADAQCSSDARCADWTGKVARSLPGGSATVGASGATGVVTINITWTQAGETTHTYSTQTALLR